MIDRCLSTTYDCWRIKNWITRLRNTHVLCLRVSSLSIYNSDPFCVFQKICWHTTFSKHSWNSYLSKDKPIKITAWRLSESSSVLFFDQHSNVKLRIFWCLLEQNMIPEFLCNTLTTIKGSQTYFLAKIREMSIARADWADFKFAIKPPGVGQRHWNGKRTSES